MIVKVNKTNDQ